VIRFSDDDEGYLAWVSAHPEGFVLNIRCKADPSYVVLHRASCGSISGKQARGAFTHRNYRKVCADSIVALRVAAQREGRGDGSFSRECGLPRAIWDHRGDRALGSER
jgi:hypothetical protein